MARFMEARRLVGRGYHLIKSTCHDDARTVQERILDRHVCHYHVLRSLSQSSLAETASVNNAKIKTAISSSCWTNRVQARLNSTLRPKTRDIEVNGDSFTDSALVRLLMRHVPHPVAVVTSAGPQITAEERKDSSFTFRGATISSFVTVTLDPTPVVCFNIMKRSSTFQAIEASDQFSMHLMNKSTEAERIATKFAGGNEARPFHDGQGKLARWVVQDCGGEKAHQAKQLPTIGGVCEKGKQIVAFRFRCKYLKEKTVEVGDHVVVFGEVVEIDSPPSEEDKEPCLLYVDGKYSQVRS